MSSNIFIVADIEFSGYFKFKKSFDPFDGNFYLSVIETEKMIFVSKEFENNYKNNLEKQIIFCNFYQDYVRYEWSPTLSGYKMYITGEIDFEVLNKETITLFDNDNKIISIQLSWSDNDNKIKDSILGTHIDGFLQNIEIEEE